MKNKPATMPESFADISQAGAYWDDHDLSDHWSSTTAVDFDVAIVSQQRYIAIEQALLAKLTQHARDTGVSTRELVNHWIAEKLR